MKRDARWAYEELLGIGLPRDVALRILAIFVTPAEMEGL